MRTHTLVGAGVTALLLGGFAAGGMTIAGDRDVGRESLAAAGKAAKALAKNDAAHAVAFAESAVALAPRDAGYRLLLGQSYLKAGRFVSAGQAFADVLTLAGDAGPQAGKAALNLALSQIAQGRWDGARTTLNDHAAVIPVRDRGLALALAGDPNGGVVLLLAATRAPDSDARTRQNLALALALSGRWSDARSVVSADVAPEEANKRIMAWMDFARPTSASDQVAKLLGVVPARDDGQPVALALAAQIVAAPVQTAAVDDTAPMPVPVAADVATAPAEVAQADIVAHTTPRIVFAARREVVQPLPASVDRPARMLAVTGAFKARLASVAKARGTGDWYVQLGAFDSAGVARDAWKRATRRYVALSAHTPAGTAFKGRAGAFYRLSVGGFGRTDAVALCRSYRAKGGACFVRTGAGDQMAAWLKPARVQTAARVRQVQFASR